MPALERPRHEAFAQAIFASLNPGSRIHNQADAYLAAGYKASYGSARRCGSRLLIFVDSISARVKELQTQAARRKRVTIETIVDELEEARELAKETEQASAMVSATSTKAKILGLSIDRLEIGKQGDFTNANSIIEIVDKLLKDAGANDISETMRIAAREELERHALAITEIASNELVLLPSPA